MLPDDDWDREDDAVRKGCESRRESRSKDSPSSRFLSAPHRCTALNPRPKDAIKSPLKRLHS